MPVAVFAPFYNRPNSHSAAASGKGRTGNDPLRRPSVLVSIDSYLLPFTQRASSSSRFTSNCLSVIKPSSSSLLSCLSNAIGDSAGDARARADGLGLTDRRAISAAWMRSARANSAAANLTSLAFDSASLASRAHASACCLARAAATSAASAAATTVVSHWATCATALHRPTASLHRAHRPSTQSHGRAAAHGRAAPHVRRSTSLRGRSETALVAREVIHHLCKQAESAAAAERRPPRTRSVRVEGVSLVCSHLSFKVQSRYK